MYIKLIIDFCIDTMINRIDFNFRKIFVSRSTLNILNTLKNDNCDETDLLLPIVSADELEELVISTIAKIIIKRSKYVNGSLK